MARFYDLGEINVMDAQGASLEVGARLAKQLKSSHGERARTVVAVDAPMQNPGAIPLILAADAALIIIRLGTSELESARSIIDIVGRDRILGTVAVA